MKTQTVECPTCGDEYESFMSVDEYGDLEPSSAGCSYACVANPIKDHSK